MALLRRSFIIAAAFGATLAHADPAPFDLAGPILEAKVTRGDSTLPISQVPNLAAGDKHLDQGRPAADAVRSLPARSRVPEWLDQPAAAQLVLQL